MSVTIAELKCRLKAGEPLGDILAFGPGQDCEIFKAEEFADDNTVIYVPDIALNRIKADQPTTDPGELEETLGICYTGNDFIEECGWDREMPSVCFGTATGSIPALHTPKSATRRKI